MAASSVPARAGVLSEWLSAAARTVCWKAPSPAGPKPGPGRKDPDGPCTKPPAPAPADEIAQPDRLEGVTVMVAAAEAPGAGSPRTARSAASEQASLERTSDFPSVVIPPGDDQQGITAAPRPRNHPYS